MTDIAMHGEARKVSIPLAIGIFLLPIIFAWFTLRKGYGRVARATALSWMGVSVLVLVTAEPQDETLVAGNEESTEVSEVAEQTTSSAVTQSPAEVPNKAVASQNESNEPVKRTQIVANDTSCSTITKATDIFIEEVAAGLKVAKSDVEFLRGTKMWNEDQCRGVFSTPKGQFTCPGSEAFKYGFSDDVYLEGSGYDVNENCRSN